MDRAEGFFVGLTLVGLVCRCVAFALRMLSTYERQKICHVFPMPFPKGTPFGSSSLPPTHAS